MPAPPDQSPSDRPGDGGGGGDTSGDRLASYRAKRAPNRTAEPFGGDRQGPADDAGGIFVVHKHHARNLHWDLRLELDGALESWAVPKGPSPDPADKRLAMHVEPHPLAYADFEGVIPAGEYGAGPTIVWDRGVWIPRADPREGLETGKLLFELRGYKLRGVWTLVHTPKAGERHWLLIKERDAYVEEGAGTEAYPDDSIWSGLEVDELPRRDEVVAALREEARERGGRPVESRGGEAGALRPRDVEVMKATTRAEPFDDPGWVFEIKVDGYRVVAGRHRSEVELRSRNGTDLTATFPEVARAVRGLPWDGLVLDGEVAVHDDDGLPSFGRLQRRGLLRNRRDIERAAREHPAVYYAFDLAGLEGLDLRGLPLVERKALLRRVLPTVGPVRYSEHVPGRGRDVFQRVVEMGLEGVVGKRADSPYVGGRSAHWVKVRVVRTADLVVVGWTEPSGSRTGFGALHLARWESGGGETPVYVGSVGTGFPDALLTELAERLRTLEVEEPTASAPRDRDGEPGQLPRGSGHHWVTPELVAEVRYRELTRAGLLRHPSFVRLREDKDPRECRGEELRGPGTLLPEPPPPDALRAPGPTVALSNLEKVFWPATEEHEAVTKGDLVAYYEAVAPWLLPWLEDRPLVLTRYPDGIDGTSFYQKDAPEWVPDWIRTVPVWSESGQRELHYFVADDVETLLYLVNLGTIPLHVWHSRVGSLTRPDWCLLDLDPKDAPFEDVVEVARFLRELCREIGLPHHVKTSGSTGLHVMIPLGRRVTYDQSRTLGELLATVAAAELPEIATVERVVSRREGRVYVDFLQNRHGQLVAAPFSARPKPGATVSAPLRWEEVGPGLRMADFTIRTVPERMEALGSDPLRPLLTETPDLLAALERLQGRTEPG